MSIGKEIRFRVYLVFIVMCILGGVVILKVIFIQQNTDKQNTRLHTREVNSIAERGNIYTESGEILCYSKPEFDLRLNFSEVRPDTFCKYLVSITRGLSQILKDYREEQYRQYFEEAFTARDKYFVLCNKIGYKEYFQIRKLPLLCEGSMLVMEQRFKLDYPFGNLALRTIGTQYDSGKYNGLEGYYNDYLKGVNSSRTELMMEGNTWMPIEGSEIEGKTGCDIVSTLDINLQEIANAILTYEIDSLDCDYGSCVVMEVGTGKIRALVNLHQVGKGKIIDDLNYALIPTEPGSTFKLVTLLSLLNDKYVTINDKIDAQHGLLRYGGSEYNDSHTGLGLISIKDAFALSSNVSFAKLGIRYYADRPEQFLKHLNDFRIGDSTGIDLLNETGCRLPSPGKKGWGVTSIPSMSIGYGVKMSPMHMCMLYNAVANGGKMMKPYLVSAILENGKPVKRFSPTTLIDHIAGPAEIRQAQECLKAVVADGTAKDIKSNNYTIAGKTGTAKVVDKDISYSSNVYQGSFVGYFPADSPKYTIAVVMRTRKDSKAYYGGVIAAPVFKMLADYFYSLETGNMNRHIDNIGSNTSRHLVEKQIAVYGVMPDVKGMGLAEVVYLLEKERMQVKVFGKGKIYRQSVNPGVKITAGTEISLFLR